LIDQDEFGQAVEMLAEARRIVLFGWGGAGALAEYGTGIDEAGLCRNG
jgi:DNA-binding MurR/RpiR family transcriptional regulator